MQQKSLFKNTIYKAILSFVNILVPVLIGSYIVKLLDVELYGIYNKVYSEFQVFLTFASFGIYTYGVREISKIRDDKEKISKLFSNLCLISLITNSIVMIIYIIYSLLSSSGITTIIYMIMIIQIIGNVFYIEFVNEALENYKFITIKTIIIKIFYFVSLLLFVRKPDDIIIYSIIICLTVFFNNIISFIYAKRHIKFNLKSVQLKKYITPLFTILVISNIELLYGQLDRVMLGKIVGDVAVTMYYIPYYLISTLISVPYSIIYVSIPRLSYVIENNGKEEYIKLLERSISSLLFIVIPICMGVFVLSKEVIFLYAGEKYMATVPTLMISCIVRIIISVESSMTNLVTYPNNKEKHLLKFSLICGLSNLVMNFILVYLKIFNPTTAIITTGIAELLLAGCQYIYANRKLNLNFKILKKETIIYFALGVCFIPISIVIRILKLGFWINTILIILICVVFYIGILYRIKDQNLVSIKDKILKKIIKKKTRLEN